MRKPTHRRGGVYLFVLSAAMLVTVIGMMVMITSQINLRVTAGTNDSIEAALLAESAVEYGLQKVASDSNWRADYTNNVATAPVPLGRGTIYFKLADAATPPATTLGVTTDPVRVYGIGQIGKTTRIYSVKCTPGAPLSCLKNALTANAITLGSSTVNGSPTIQSNTSITGLSAVLTGATLNASTSVSLGSLLNVTVNTGVPPAEMPDPNHAFDYYIQNGTNLSIGSIPVVSGNPTLQYKCISPVSNPCGGGTNSRGIYVIDCQGQNLIISATRVMGTLVILNPGSGSAIQTQDYFAPAVKGYPCLMVQGDMTIKANNTNLADSSANGINYNQNTPYMGVTDSTYTTQYPSRFDGLLYVSGNLTTQSVFSTQGTVVVGGTWSSSGTANLAYDATTYNNPPPGFTSGKLVPISASWQWESQ